MYTNCFHFVTEIQKYVLSKSYIHVYSRGLIKFYKHTGEKQVNFDYIMAFFNILPHLVYLITIVYTLVNVFIVTFEHFTATHFPTTRPYKREFSLHVLRLPYNLS